LISNGELIARIDALASNAIGSSATDSSVSTERADALDRYYGRPYGDEIDGRSKVTSRDLAETVDWIMPSIMRVMLSSGNVVEFLPEGPEDVPLAEQESDATNHVMLEENNAFLYLHDWFKDALILRNGYVKTWWEETEKTTVEEYTGLFAEDVTKLLMGYEERGCDCEVLEQSENPVTLIIGDVPQEVPTFDLKLRVTTKKGAVKITAVPAEEVLVSKRCRGDLDDADYVEHKTVIRRTDLIEMGMPDDFVNTLPANSNEHSSDQTSRDRDGESWTDESIDHSMDEIEYRECCVRVDADEDGKAELRRVVIVGKKIPPGEEWNKEVPFQYFAFATPKRMPHRHMGESIYDEIVDLQLVKTILTRGLLDNTYGLTNAEFVINERANLDDFLVTKPLGVKRVEGKQPVEGSFSPINKPNILGQVLPAIDYIDKVKQVRTGVVPASTGVDANILKDVRRDSYMENLNQANAKIEMICRMFAEIGLKSLAKKVHALLIMHQDKPKMMRLRNKFVMVDPQQWKERENLKVTVGLGNGNREETKDTIRLIAEAQGILAQSYGLVGPEEAYHSFADLCRALGKPNPENYAINPSPDNPKYQEVMQRMAQQQSNPLAEAEQVKAQAQLQITQIKEQGEREKAQMKLQLENQKQMMLLQKQEFESQEAALRLQLDQRQQAFKEYTDNTQASCDLAIMAAKARTEQDLVDFKTELAKRTLEAETAELVAERERIKLEVQAAQIEFEKQQIEQHKNAQKEINKGFADMHHLVIKELAKTVQALSRPRKTRVLSVDSDGVPTESISEIT